MSVCAEYRRNKREKHIVNRAISNRCCRTYLVWLLFILFATQAFFLNAREVPENYLSNPSLVKAFYKERSDSLFWYKEDSLALPLRQQLMALLDHCDLQGLNKHKYPYEALKTRLFRNNNSSDQVMAWDRLYTDAAIAYLKDVFTGAGLEHMISYDAISKISLDKENDFLLGILSHSGNSSGLAAAVKGLEPHTAEYRQLTQAMSEALLSGQYERSSRLATALNCYRWIHHFRFDKCIVVNIPSGTLRYLEGDSVGMTMKIVAGTPQTPTPRFAAYCDEVILYPYWNVPHSIAVNEMLPAAKKSIAILDFLNLQVIDRDGNILDPGKLNWSKYNKGNFPYRFRQSTGCDNALGVIKFNVTSPYSVYLHDTNMKFAFAGNKKYLSHGCIRIEKPIELANCLLDHPLDRNFLNACVKNQLPQHLLLKQAVPVLVVYVTVEVDMDDNLIFYDDVYGLL